MQHADSVENAEAVKEQAEAILTQRLLLAEPDPVPPLCNDLSARLRETFSAAYRRYQAAYYEAINTLNAAAAWEQLPDYEAATILSTNALREPRAPDVSTEDKLLAAFGAHPLSSLETAIAALPTRVDKALTEASKFLEPKAVSLQFPKTTLKTEGEVERYLSELKDEIMRHIAEDRPVIL